MGPGKGGQFWWGKDKHGNRRRDNPPGARPGPGAAAGPAAAYGTSRREDKAAAARGKEEAAAEGRARGKRKAPKRCRGMCFQAPPPPPALAVADKAGRAEAKKARLRERKRERAEAAAAARAAEAPPGAGAEPASQRAKRAKIPDGVEDLPGTFAEALQRLGFAEPTRVQRACWGPGLAGRDLIAQAEPGTGKTLGYLLPTAHRLAKRHGGRATGRVRFDAPAALVIVPTRELATQVRNVCRPLKAVFPLPASALVGGVPKTSQLEELEVKRPAIVVGTPGRLADLAAAGELQLGRVEVVVLDEADKMMQMGFADQLAALRGHFPTAPPPQTLLFSATFPRALAAACDEWLAEPVRIDVTAAANASDGSGGGGGLQIGAGVTQEVAVCAEHKKPRRLLKHLAAVREGSVGQRHEARVLIFANKIKTVRFLHGLLKKHDVRCLMLHGLRSQAERRAALQSFKSGKVPVLVATDVAARGLDIAALPHVVCYDFPPTLEQYVHRVGRTGRAARAGHALSFFPRTLAPLAPDLVRLLKAHNQRVDPYLQQLADATTVALDRLEKGEGAEGAGQKPKKPAKRSRGASRGLDAVDQAMRAEGLL